MISLNAELNETSKNLVRYLADINQEHLWNSSFVAIYNEWTSETGQRLEHFESLPVLLQIIQDAQLKRPDSRKIQLMLKK